METLESALSVLELSIIAEEEALLRRAQAALTRAAANAPPTRSRDLLSIDALRALRDDAKAASADDLPPLLLELSIRQSLLARAGDAPLPDARAPYMAHLRVDEGGATKDYLLGKCSFLETGAGVRIVDWRVAPIAQVFYRYREGDDYEEAFPGRTAEGSVVARRITVIAGGELQKILGDGVALTRSAAGTWAREAHGAPAFTPLEASDGAPPDVTALLDAEQFAAISAPAEQPLVVLGSAGSGKTTVALHRLARIAASEPARFPLASMAVVVPEEGLARLSRRLLMPLGVGETQVRTLDTWFHAAARCAFGKALPPMFGDTPPLVASLKRSPALFDGLCERLGAHARGRPRQTLMRLRAQLADAFTDRAFLASVVARSSGALSASAIEETVRHTMMQVSAPLAKELRAITDDARKVAIDGLPIGQGTPGDVAGTLDFEELPILLFSQQLRSQGAPLGLPTISHLVVDEAEDVSLFELAVLGSALGEGRSVTLAGDEAQQTTSSFAGFARSLHALGVANATQCRLEVSYRCPAPVTELARAILGPLAPEAPARAPRNGPPVQRFAFPTEQQSQIFLSGALRSLLDREPRASVGVLARDLAAARRIHELLRDRSDARLVLHGDFTFAPGVDVTDVESAKGLEFDYVVVPDATAEAYPVTHDARRRLHVAVTRTSHALWLIAGGAATSALLPPLEC